MTPLFCYRRVLQQQVKRSIAVGYAVWVAKGGVVKGKYNRVLVISNRCEKSQKHCKKRDLSHTLPLAPLGGELRFEMTNTIQTHQFIAKILYRTQVNIICYIELRLTYNRH